MQRLKDGVLVCQHQHSLELMRSRNAWSFSGKSHEAVWGGKALIGVNIGATALTQHHYAGGLVPTRQKKKKNMKGIQILNIPNIDPVLAYVTRIGITQVAPSGLNKCDFSAFSVQDIRTFHIFFRELMF